MSTISSSDYPMLEQAFTKAKERMKLNFPDYQAVISSPGKQHFYSEETIKDDVQEVWSKRDTAIATNVAIQSLVAEFLFVQLLSRLYADEARLSKEEILTYLKIIERIKEIWEILTQPYEKPIKKG